MGLDFGSWMLKIGLGCCLSLGLYGGESMASDLPKHLLTLQEQAHQPEALKEWVTTHSKQAKELQNWLLADALFARLHQLPTLTSDSLTLLKSLTQLLPPDPDIQTTISLLEAEDFRDRITRPPFQAFAHDQHDQNSVKGDEGDSLSNWLLNQGQDYLYYVRELPKVEDPLTEYPLDYRGLTHKSFTDQRGESGPEKLIIDFYLADSQRDLKQLERIERLARDYGMQSLSILALLEQARLLRSKDHSEIKADLRAMLNQALQRAQKLESPVLEVHALLALAKAGWAELGTVERLIADLPESEMKLYLKKLWADHLLKTGQLEAARKIWLELAKSEKPWMLLWLIDSIAQTHDSQLLPLVEQMTQYPQESLAQHAIWFWLRLVPPQRFEKEINRLQAQLPETRAGYLLAVMPLTNTYSEHNLLRIRSALASDKPQLQLGALSYLIQIYSNQYGSPKAVPLLPEVTQLLKSPETEVQQKALHYLGQNKHYDKDAMLTLLKSPDIRLQDSVLQTLLVVPEQVPIAAIKPLLKSSSPQVQLKARALLVLKGELTGLEDFIAIWRHPELFLLRGLDECFASALEQGQISWKSWREALERAQIPHSISEDDENPSPEIQSAWRIQSGLFSGPRLFSTPTALISHLDALLAQSKLNALTLEYMIHLLWVQPHTPTRTHQLIGLAHHHSERVRQAALNYLAKAPSPELKSLFQTALGDPADSIKMMAVRYLVTSEPEYILNWLHKTEQSLIDRDVLDSLEHLTSSKISTQALKTVMLTINARRSEDFQQELICQLILQNEKSSKELLNALLIQTPPDSSNISLLLEQPDLIENETLQQLLSASDPKTRATGLLLAIHNGDLSLFNQLALLLDDHALLTPKQVSEAGYELYPKEAVSLRELALNLLLELNPQGLRKLLPAYTQDSDAKFRTRVLKILKQNQSSSEFQDNSQQKGASQHTQLDNIVEILSAEPERVEAFRHQGLPGEISWEQIYTELLNQLSHYPSDETDRDKLLMAIIAIRGQSALPDLLKVLNKSPLNPDYLTPIIQPEDIPELTKMVQEAHSPEHLSVGLVLLNHLGVSEQASLAVPLLNHQDISVKFAAYDYLGRHGSDQQRQVLMDFLQLVNSRHYALRALELKPLPAAIPKILELFQVGDSSLREAAIILAGRWQLHQALPELLAMIAPEAPGPGKDQAIWALGQIGDPAAIPALQDLSKNLSLNQIEALYRLGDFNTARLALLEYFKIPHPDLHVEALDLLADLEVDDPQLVPFLLEILPKEESGTRMRRGKDYIDLKIGEQAAQLLAKIALPEHVPDLIRSLQNLPFDRHQEICSILDVIFKRQPDWPAEVLTQIKTLSLDADPQIRELATSWMQRLKAKSDF